MYKKEDSYVVQQTKEFFVALSSNPNAFINKVEKNNQGLSR